MDSGNDPYAYPGTDVLRNRFGIRDAALLQARETDGTTLVLARLERSSLPGTYDLAHLQAFHREIFGPIYPWAGELRTVAIAKTQLFCLPQHIEGYAADVFGGLARNDRLRGRDRGSFLDGLADLWADVNALHPFREGNGRSTRAFLHQLGRDAGWPVTWAGIDPQENIRAAVASLDGDNTGLRRILDRQVLPAPPAAEGAGRPGGALADLEALNTRLARLPSERPAQDRRPEPGMQQQNRGQEQQRPGLER